MSGPERIAEKIADAQEPYGICRQVMRDIIAAEVAPLVEALRDNAQSIPTAVMDSKAGVWLVQRQQRSVAALAKWEK